MQDRSPGHRDKSIQNGADCAKFAWGNDGEAKGRYGELPMGKMHPDSFPSTSTSNAWNCWPHDISSPAAVGQIFWWASLQWEALAVWFFPFEDEILLKLLTVELRTRAQAHCRPISVAWSQVWQSTFVKTQASHIKDLLKIQEKLQAGSIVQLVLSHLDLATMPVIVGLGSSKNRWADLLT